MFLKSVRMCIEKKKIYNEITLSSWSFSSEIFLNPKQAA